ncbi:MAG: tetratricopeptide repeat protein [Candidatus Binatia bacterium]
MTASNQTTAIAPLLFARGQEALQAGQYETAVALLKEATELDATDATYHLWLGRAYGHQAEHAGSGEQFFLARQVRKNLEKAVALNPDLIEARLDLLSYYLQAPLLLGGGIEKAKAQAAEITKRDPHQGALAQQQCQQAAEEEPALFAVSRED